MPIIRNPFRKQDENVRPASASANASGTGSPANGPTSKPLDIKEKEPTEYKLSEINDSGVYLPPSPPERKSKWTGRTNSSRSTATTSSNHRSLFDENEPFNISRESFDSYRRSFDISARSPVLAPNDYKPRASLDSRTFAAPTRSSNSFNRPLQVPGTQQEEREPPEPALEDVSLADEAKPPQPKKRGVFSRMLDSSDSHSSERPASAEKAMPWHHFGGRKRGQSGQGSELGSIPRQEEAPKPESQLRKEETIKPESQLKREEKRASVASSGHAQSASASAEPGNAQAPEIRVDAERG